MRRTVLVAAGLSLVSAVGGLALAPSAGAQGASGATLALIKAGDQICAASNAKLKEAAGAYERHIAVQTRGAGSSRKKVAKPKDVGEFIRAVAGKEIAGQLQQLNLLQAPAADAKAYTQLLDEANKALKQLLAAPDRAALTDPFAKVSKDFRAFGFSACGQNAKAVASIAP